MWRLRPGADVARAAAYRGRDRAGASRCTATTRSGSSCAAPSPRSTIASRSTARLERRDGSVVDCATVPLPDGATLVTFQDVTDTVNVERALSERNEALEDADQLKIDFVHHVSYELRSPLTNIIGFAHFLGDPVDRAADREAARISRATSRSRPTRCSPSSTTSSISPPSTPAR